MKKIAILGAGPAGLAVAWTLKGKFEIDLYERGKSLENRMKESELDITSGFGGAGAFSDGKVTLSPQVGVNQQLLDLYGEREIAKQLQRVDKFFLAHGAPEGHIKSAEYPEDFKRQCRIAQFSLIDKAAVRHIGTDAGHVVISNILNELKNKVNVFCEVEVEVDSFNIIGDKIHLVAKFNDGSTHAETYDYVIIAVGRSGAGWIKELYDAVNLPHTTGVVDVGVRIETKQEVFADFYNTLSYEPKLSMLSSFGERVRSFCCCLGNSGSTVALESYKHLTDEHGNPLKLANGHSYSEGDDNHYTGNANLAILVSLSLTEPFKDSIGYARSIGQMVNTLADGNLLVQSYRDLKKQRRSTDSRILETGITPSLKEGWLPGDISLAIPPRIMTGITEFIDGMSKLFPGVENCLMYALEAKLYSNKAKIAGKDLHYVGYPNIFACGDGSGLTRALSAATMHGMLVADKILEKES